MWYWAYNIAATAVLAVGLPLLPLLFLCGSRYRAGFAQRLGFYPSAVGRSLAGSRPVWIHAASVGEVRSAQPLMHEIKARRPECKVLLSTFTATGNRLAQQMAEADGVIYLPLDLPWLARRPFRIFGPRLVIVIETEIWPNLVRAASDSGVPIILLSGRLSERAFSRYWRLRSFFSRVLRRFTALGMQSPADAARIASLGADKRKIAVTGSLKFAPPRGSAAGAIAPIRRNPPQLVFVAGSSHPGEEEIILAAFKSVRERFPALALVLAPRHPERFTAVERLLAESGLSFQRKTNATRENYFATAVLLLDTVGDLPEFFAAADITFVGGSLVDVGGHNLLEPARLQRPILFGPHMDNFRGVAEEMKRRGAALEVRDVADLATALRALAEDCARRRKMGEAAAEVAAAGADALIRNLDLAERYL